MFLNRWPAGRGSSRDRPARRHPSTTHQPNAWKRHTCVRASRERSTGPPAVVWVRDECGVSATSEHPDHTLIAAGSNRSIRRFSVAVLGRPAPGLGRRLQPFAALGRTCATPDPCGRTGGRGNFLRLIGLREDSALIRKVTQRACSYGAYTSVGFDRTPGSKWMPPTARRKGLPPQVIGTISGWSHRGAALEVHLFIAGS
jgi:hypothetical protein